MTSEEFAFFRVACYMFMGTYDPKMGVDPQAIQELSANMRRVYIAKVDASHEA
jgi:hypothetical protein